MQQFYVGLAEILEVDVAKLTPALILGDYAWDSLAVISTIALIDELHGKIMNGEALTNCVTVSDIEALIAKSA